MAPNPFPLCIVDWLENALSSNKNSHDPRTLGKECAPEICSLETSVIRQELVNICSENNRAKKNYQSLDARIHTCVGRGGVSPFAHAVGHLG